jgi:hypothetical protein
MKRSVVIKRLGYEASEGWTTYGTTLAAFSLFQVIGRDMKTPLISPLVILFASDQLG